MFAVRCLACEYSVVPLTAHLHFGGEGEERDKRLLYFQVKFMA